MVNCCSRTRRMPFEVLHRFMRSNEPQRAAASLFQQFLHLTLMSTMASSRFLLRSDMPRIVLRPPLHQIVWSTLKSHSFVIRQIGFGKWQMMCRRRLQGLRLEYCGARVVRARRSASVHTIDIR